MANIMKHLCLYHGRVWNDLVKSGWHTSYVFTNVIGKQIAVMIKESK